MTTLPEGWENQGGRVLIKRSAGADVGDTIGHPLKGPLPGEATGYEQGLWNRSRWTNTDAEDFPSGMGAKTADAASDTLDGALAATPE
jgi:hypothetical protein